MSGASTSRRLAALLAPVVAETGLDLEDVVVSGQGRRTEVRVLVDRDGGVSLDDVAVVSEAISAVLDRPDADVVVGAPSYVLEVSSPGVDRPLLQPRHWRRNVGRLVRVTPTSGEPGSSPAGAEITARIIAVDDDGVRLTVPARPRQPDEERTYRFADLGAGRVQVEFNRPAGGTDGDSSASHGEGLE